MATSATARVAVATLLAVLPIAEATSPVISQVAQATLPVVFIAAVVRSIGALTTEQLDSRVHITTSMIAGVWSLIAINMKGRVGTVNYAVGGVGGDNKGVWATRPRHLCREHGKEGESPSLLSTPPRRAPALSLNQNPES